MEIRRSDCLDKLTQALAKAQLSFAPVLKESNNPFYKSMYADLATLITATRPALAAEGLVVVQVPGNLTGAVIEVSSMLLHSSNQFLAFDLKFPVPKLDAQGIGTAITYARRYSYQALLCLGAEDDDGNAASGKTRPPAFSEDEYDQRTEGQLRISPSQVSTFFDAVKKSGRTQRQTKLYLKNHCAGIVQVEEMLRNQWNDAIKWAHNATPDENLAETLTESVVSIDVEKKAAERVLIPIDEATGD